MKSTEEDHLHTQQNRDNVIVDKSVGKPTLQPKFSYTLDDFFMSRKVNILLEISKYIFIFVILAGAILATIHFIGWINMLEWSETSIWIIAGVVLWGICQFLILLIVLGIIYLSIRKKKSIQNKF